MRPVNFDQQIARTFGKRVKTSGRHGKGLPIVDDIGYRLAQVNKALAQKGQRNGVKRANRRRVPDSERLQSSPHFTCRFTGKCNRQNVSGLGTSGGDAISDAIRKNSCFA
jgi:hypothetical protein